MTEYENDDLYASMSAIVVAGCLRLACKVIPQGYP
jgi:hypothetical protein